MIIMLAGLQDIPREVEEAALVDGASRNQTLRHITLPLLGPTIRVSVFLSIIGALQLFDLVWATTKGGPVNASNTMAIYMYDWGVRRRQLGLRQRHRGASSSSWPSWSRCSTSASSCRRDIEGAVTRWAE